MHCASVEVHGTMMMACKRPCTLCVHGTLATEVCCAWRCACMQGGLTWLWLDAPYGTSTVCVTASTAPRPPIDPGAAELVFAL